MSFNNIFILGFIFLLSCGVSNKVSKEYKKNTALKNDYLIEVIENDTIIYKVLKGKSTLIEGRTEIHFKNGDIAFGSYQSNKKNGAWEYYDKNKELYKIEHYTEGFLSRIEIYEKGKFVSQAITDPTF
jgi:hypothetical protein